LAIGRSTDWDFNGLQWTGGKIERAMESGGHPESRRQITGQAQTQTTLVGLGLVLCDIEYTARLAAAQVAIPDKGPPRRKSGRSSSSAPSSSSLSRLRSSSLSLRSQSPLSGASQCESFSAPPSHIRHRSAALVSGMAMLRYEKIDE
jgi:hypothetical protein